MKDRNLYVGNLSLTVTTEILWDLFSVHGEIREIRPLISKGFAFIEMSNSEEAEKARKALNGFILEGRALEVNYARPRGLSDLQRRDCGKY